MLHTFAKFILKLLFLFTKVEVQGTEKIPESGGIIICGNHFSNLDPILIAISIKRQLHFMAKKELFKQQWFGNLITKLGAFPVDREKNSVLTLKNTLKLLKEEKSILIFPQGTRNSNLDISSIKSGVGFLALKSGVPIIPFYISGHYGFLGKIKLSFGNPIIFPKELHTSKDLVESATQKIANCILELNLI